MHFSDHIKTALMAIIDKMAADPRQFVVNPEKDFTRNRKMGLRDTLLMLLTMEGDCIKEEIYRFFGRNKEAPSKSAFYRQRCKLNSQALPNLLSMFNQNLPKELYNGKYQLIACDGSAADIFRDPNNPDTFFEPNGIAYLISFTRRTHQFFYKMMLSVCLLCSFSHSDRYIFTKTRLPSQIMQR